MFEADRFNVLTILFWARVQLEGTRSSGRGAQWNWKVVVVKAGEKSRRGAEWMRYSNAKNVIFMKKKRKKRGDADWRAGISEIVNIACLQRGYWGRRRQRTVWTCEWYGSSEWASSARVGRVNHQGRFQRRMHNRSVDSWPLPSQSQRMTAWQVYITSNQSPSPSSKTCDKSDNPSTVYAERSANHNAATLPPRTVRKIELLDYRSVQTWPSAPVHRSGVTINQNDRNWTIFE